MCETHQALSSASARRAESPQIPAAAKMRPPIARDGGFEAKLPDVTLKAKQALAPPMPKVEREKVAPKKVQSAPQAVPALPEVDPWAREAAREMSRTMKIGLSRKETQRVAQAVTEVVGKNALIEDIKARALNVIREKISAIGTERTAVATKTASVKTVSSARPKGSLHLSNRSGGAPKRQQSRPQYGQYARRPVTIDEPAGPAPVTNAEMQRRIAAVRAAQAAENDENEDGD